MATVLLASFLASLVECVEALTVILAVGSVRGWRSALTGAAAAIALLGLLTATLGRSLARMPLHLLQAVVGVLLLLFGLRWLRKAILRAAGVLALRDEAAAYAKARSRAQVAGSLDRKWDTPALTTTFNITMLEGSEVIFIVIATGAPASLLQASLGACAALMVVAVLGLTLHRPLSRVPENTLKFAVGVLLSAFGTFWVGEGLSIAWPASDWSLPALVGVFLATALLLTALCRRWSQAVQPGRAT